MARRKELTQRDIKLGVNLLFIIISGFYALFNILSMLGVKILSLIFSGLYTLIRNIYKILVNILTVIFSGFYSLFKNVSWTNIGIIIYLVVVTGAYAFFKSLFVILCIAGLIVGLIAGITILLNKVLRRIKAAIARKKSNNTEEKLKLKQIADTGGTTKQSELISALTTAARSKAEFDATTIAKLEEDLKQIKFKLDNEKKETQRATDLLTTLFETERIKADKQIALLEGELIHARAISQNSIKFDNEYTIDASRVGRLEADLTDTDWIKIDSAKLERLETELYQARFLLDKRIKIEVERKSDEISLAALKANSIKVHEITNERRPIGLGDFKKPNEAAQITPTNKLPASDNKIVFKTAVTQARKELDNLKKAAELFPERYDSARIKAEEKLADLNNKAKLAREQRIRLDVVFNQEKLSREFDQARVVREKRIKAEADINQSKIAREKSKQLEAEVERIKVIETSNEKSEKIHAIQQARVARYNRVKAEADINQSKIAIQNAKRVSDLFSAQTESASYKALNKETTLKILLTQANIALENYIKLEAEQAANTNKGTGLENDPFEANRKATAKKTVGLSVELNQASLALETQIKSESEVSKVIETKSERPEYANNNVNSIEQSVTPITSKDKFTDNLKELPVNIIKDENTDKFEGMF